MTTYDNINNNLIVNPLFVVNAIEAGIDLTIRSLVASDPMSVDELILAIRQTLWDTNRPLAEGINHHTLGSILRYLNETGRGVAIHSRDIADVLDMDGAGGIWHTYDAIAKTLSLTWSSPPEDFGTQIIIDNVIVAYTEVRDENDNNADIVLHNINLAPGNHIVRTVYRRISDGALSRLGNSSVINV